MNKIVFPPMPLIPLFMDASCRAEITSIIRARDIEVARLVLEAAARIAEKHFHSTTAKQIRAALEAK